MMISTRQNDFVFAVSPRSGREIDTDAETVLRRFYPKLLEHPGRFDVLHFFDHILRDEYHLDTAVDGEMSDGVEGMAYPDGRVYVSESTYSLACEGLGRPRFTIAHEAYHGIKHRGQIQRVLVHTGQAVLYRRHAIPAFRDPEWQADRFAASLLMPGAMVKRVVRSAGPVSAVDAIIETFSVSRRAAEIRAHAVSGIAPRRFDV